MNLKQRINLALIVIATVAAPAYAQQFELKGNRWGTKEVDFRKANPKAKCGDTGDKRDLLPGEVRSRLCTLPDFTVAGQVTTDARFLFINGELQSMGFFLFPFAIYDLKESLVAKHGQPTTTRYDSVTWELKDARLWILKLDDQIAFNVDSPVALAHRARVQAQSAKRGAADL